MVHAVCAARFPLDNGLGVVIEGIPYSQRYGEMLTQLRDDHLGLAHRCHCELALDETLLRHRARALATDVSEADVTGLQRCRAESSSWQGSANIGIMSTVELSGFLAALGPAALPIAVRAATTAPRAADASGPIAGHSGGR